MRRIDASGLIELSERGAGLGNASRALLVLEACGLATRDDGPALTLGARDRLLAKARAGWFGDPMVARQRCARCGEPFEMTLTADDVGLDAPPAEAEPREVALGGEGSGHRVRALTAGDMIAAEAAESVEQAHALLLRRAAPEVPEDSVDPASVAEALERIDPLADIRILAACPACGAEAELCLDLPGFVWREIEQRVPRILREVADLARAYHWSERDILAMPASRRSFYLAAAQ